MLSTILVNLWEITAFRICMLIIVFLLDVKLGAFFNPVHFGPFKFALNFATIALYMYVCSNREHNKHDWYIFSGSCLKCCKKQQVAKWVERSFWILENTIIIPDKSNSFRFFFYFYYKNLYCGYLLEWPQ